MGSWDYAPWDNDAAADWFDGVFEETGLADHVESSLNLDPEMEADEIRAAATLLILLGRVYMWPVDRLEPQLRLAIQKLEAIIEVSEMGEESEFRDQIEKEIEALKRRLRSFNTDAPAPPSTKDLDLSSWWASWM